MIVRMGLNYGAHLAAGIVMGALAVLAAAYVTEQKRRQRDGGAGEPAPAAAGGGPTPPRSAERVADAPAEGEVSGDPGAI